MNSKAMEAKLGLEQYELFQQSELRSAEDIKKLIEEAFPKSKMNVAFIIEMTDKGKDIFKNKVMESYVWIGLTEEDFVVVVGKSIKRANNLGDLFSSYRIWSGVTPRLITELITNEEEKRILAKIEKHVNGYIKKAIIIPNNKCIAKTINEQETIIGNILLSNNIPILNKYSHNYGR